jgi:hypothetical protein
VLKGKITGSETDPYDIHEMPISFQHPDSEYKFLEELVDLIVRTFWRLIARDYGYPRSLIMQTRLGI